MEQSEIEVLVGELETRVDRLRSLYDQYFMGIERLEPLVPRKDVERRLAVLRKEQIRNTGLRYKFNVIIQRFNTYQTYWLRIARQIEQGTYRRDVIRATARFGVDPTKERRAAAAAAANEEPEPATNPTARVIPEDIDELEDGSAFLVPLDVEDEPIAAKATHAIAPPRDEFSIDVELDDLAAPFEEHDPFPRPPAPAPPAVAPRLGATVAPKLRIAPLPGMSAPPNPEQAHDERRETERRMPAASIAVPRIATRSLNPNATGTTQATAAPPRTNEPRVIVTKRAVSTVSPDELAPPASGPSAQRPTALPGAVSASPALQRPTTLPGAVPPGPALQRPTTLPGAVPANPTLQRPTTLPGAVAAVVPALQRPTTLPGAVPAGPALQPRPTTLPGAVSANPTLQRPTTLPGAVPAGPALQPRPTTLPGAVPAGPALQPRPTTLPGAVSANPTLQRPTTLPGAVPANATLQRPTAQTVSPPVDPTRAPPLPRSATTAPGALPVPPIARPSAPTVAPRAPAPLTTSPPVLPTASPAIPPPRPVAAADVGDLSNDRFGQLYSKYVETRRERNEPTHAITREALAKQLTESTERLRQKHGGKPIDFEVVVKDGKTILRAIVK